MAVNSVHKMGTRLTLALVALAALSFGFFACEGGAHSAPHESQLEEAGGAIITVEIEPNDNISSAQVISADCTCQEFTLSEGDIDFFFVPASAGTRLQVSATSDIPGDEIRLSVLEHFFPGEAETAVVGLADRAFGGEVIHAVAGPEGGVYLRIEPLNGPEDGALPYSYSVTIASESRSEGTLSFPIIDTLSVDEGGTLTHTFSASSSAPETELEFEMYGAPSGVTLDPISGQISWSPGYDNGGFHRFVVAVRDTSGVTTDVTWQEVLVRVNERFFGVISDISPNDASVDWGRFGRGPASTSGQLQPVRYFVGMAELDSIEQLDFSIDTDLISPSTTVFTLQSKPSDTDATKHQWLDVRTLTPSEVSAETFSIQQTTESWDYRLRMDVAPTDPAHPMTGDTQFSNLMSVNLMHHIENLDLGLTDADGDGEPDEEVPVPVGTVEENPVKMWEFDEDKDEPGKIHIVDEDKRPPELCDYVMCNPENAAPGIAKFMRSWLFSIKTTYSFETSKKDEDTGTWSDWEPAETSNEPEDPDAPGERDTRQPEGWVCLPKEAGKYRVRMCCETKGHAISGPMAPVPPEIEDACTEEELQGNELGKQYSDPVYVDVPCWDIGGDTDGDGDIDDDDHQKEDEGECSIILPNCDYDENPADDDEGTGETNDGEDEEIGNAEDLKDVSPFEVKLDCPLPQDWSIKVTQTKGTERSRVFGKHQSGAKSTKPTSSATTSSGTERTWKFDDQLDFQEDPSNPVPPADRPEFVGTTDPVTGKTLWKMRMGVESFRGAAAVTTADCELVDGALVIDQDKYEQKNTITFEVSICDDQGNEVGKKTTKLWLAQFRSSSNSQSSSTVQMLKPEGASDPITETRDDLKALEAGCGFSLEELDVPDGDRWIQDLVEYGEYVRPGSGSNPSQTVKAMVLLPRTSRRGASSTSKKMKALAQHANRYVIDTQDSTDSHPISSVSSSMSSGGNLESLCDFGEGNIPIIGTVTSSDTNDGGHVINGDLECYLASNAVDPSKPNPDTGDLESALCRVNTGWLDVGHVDEILSTRYHNGKCHIFIASTKLAQDLLSAEKTSSGLKGDAVLYPDLVPLNWEDFNGNGIKDDCEEYADWTDRNSNGIVDPNEITDLDAVYRGVTLDDVIVIGQTVYEQQVKAQILLNNVKNQIRQCLSAQGLTENTEWKFVEIPTIYVRTIKDCNTPPFVGWTVLDRTGAQSGAFSSLDSLSPNMVWAGDCVMLGKTSMVLEKVAGGVLPHSENPLLKDYIAKLKPLLGNDASKVKEVEIHDAYHINTGGCHCATNVPR